jgi:hypothetical protein
VKHEEEIKLRKNLKRKQKPAVEDPASVPMEVYFSIVSYDGKMFQQFVKLSKGMRKHLLFHVFEIMAPSC